MESLVAGALLVLVGVTLAYLMIAKIILPIISMIKENARLK